MMTMDFCETARRLVGAGETGIVAGAWVGLGKVVGNIFCSLNETVTTKTGQAS